MRAGAAEGLLAALALGLASPPALADGAAPRGAVRCLHVAAGAGLQAALDAAPEGASLCLDPGDHVGPVVVARRVTLSGPREARLVSRGSGSTIRLRAPGAALERITVDGSGGRFEQADAAVRIEADDVRVEGVRVVHALFGILAERVHRAHVVGNEVEGNPAKVLGLRGDAIRLWEVRDSEILRNRVRDARDLVAWYAPNNRFAENVVERGRYGIHFMYSHGCRVERNRFDADVVGVFVMYSHGVRLEGNEIRRSAGAAGMGIGVKESGDLVVRDNVLVANNVGLYLDQSPLDPRETNRVERNLFAGHDRAIVFLGRAARNHFLGNAFRANGVQVALDGGGDALEAEWRGNAFDDYLGYDLDGDGVGDVPYEARSLAGDWLRRAPSLGLFRGTPALALAEWLGEAVPLFRPTTLMVDSAPRMLREAAHAH